MELYGGDRLEKVAIDRSQLHVPLWDDSTFHQRKGVKREAGLSSSDKGAGYGGEADESGEEMDAAEDWFEGIDGGGGAWLQHA